MIDEIGYKPGVYLMRWFVISTVIFLIQRGFNFKLVDSPNHLSVIEHCDRVR